MERSVRGRQASGRADGGRGGGWEEGRGWEERREAGQACLPPEQLPARGVRAARCPLPAHRTPRLRRERSAGSEERRRRAQRLRAPPTPPSPPPSAPFTTPAALVSRMRARARSHALAPTLSLSRSSVPISSSHLSWLPRPPMHFAMGREVGRQGKRQERRQT
eukprot:3055948-Rhodomonas_salina.1